MAARLDDPARAERYYGRQAAPAGVGPACRAGPFAWGGGSFLARPDAPHERSRPAGGTYSRRGAHRRMNHVLTRDRSPPIAQLLRRAHRRDEGAGPAGAADLAPVRVQAGADGTPRG